MMRAYAVSLDQRSKAAVNVSHGHREIDHCVVTFFRAAPGLKAGGREVVAVQPLTATERETTEAVRAK